MLYRSFNHRIPNPSRRIQAALKTSNVAENLVQRKFEEFGPRTILLTDITYIPYSGGRCYLSTILDAFTKQVLAYVPSDSLEVDFVLDTVNLLIENHKISMATETIIHSDQGSHYTSVKFIQLVKDSGLRQSMSRRGNCWDNAPQESFFGHMKNERYQWDLAKLSPNEYYKYCITGEYPLPLYNPKEK